MSIIEQQTQNIINKIQEWGGQGEISIVYDSDYYPSSTENFIECVSHKSKLFFINFDEFNNIFGCYTNQPITTLDKYEDTYDQNHFLFSIFSNGRIKKPTRYFTRDGRPGGIKIHSKKSDGFYGIGSNGMGHGCFNIDSPGEKDSWCHYLSHTYAGISGNEITGTHWKYPNFQRFIIHRILVIQLYC